MSRLLFSAVHKNDIVKVKALLNDKPNALPFASAGEEAKSDILKNYFQANTFLIFTLIFQARRYTQVGPENSRPRFCIPIRAAMRKKINENTGNTAAAIRAPLCPAFSGLLLMTPEMMLPIRIIRTYNPHITIPAIESPFDGESFLELAYSRIRAKSNTIVPNPVKAAFSRY